MSSGFVSSKVRSKNHRVTWLWHKKKLDVWITRFVFLFPGLLYFGLFYFYPVAYSFYLSLFRSNILTIRKEKLFVGLNNYIEIFQDPVFLKAIFNTFYFSFWTVGGTLILGLVLATLFLHVCPWVEKVGRSMAFIPVITLMVAAAVLWEWLFQTSFGLVNYLLGFLGLGPYPWLGSFELAMPSVIIMTIWKDLGFTMIIFFTALLQIPHQYLEAGDIDGAGEFKKWWYVELPLLRPVTLLIIVIQIIKSFQVFTQVFVMTGGGPGNATRTLVQYAYEKGFVYWSMGQAAAISVMLLIAILFMSLIQFRYFGEFHES